MTDAQTEALRALCERYRVAFDAEHYAPRFDLPEGYVAGWVGGPQGAELPRRTIFVGVAPDGAISS